jgi:lysophospholipase L1-like esterase
MRPIGLGLGLSLGSVITAAALNALNDRIVFDGDSILAHGYIETGAYAGNGSWGFSTWALALSEGRLFQPVSGNVAVSGDTIADIYARKAATLALAPRVLVVLIGTNDLDAGTSAAAIEAVYQNYIDDMLVEAVRYLVLLTVPPRFSPNALAAGEETQRGLLNAWIRSRASAHIKVVDCDTLGLTTDDFEDGLHPNNGGAFKIGGAVATVLNATTAKGDSIASWTNVYAPNSTMAGTGGATNGGASGQVADSFNLDATQAGGATIVGSKGTMADGSPAQIVTISGNYSGDGRYINFATFVASSLVAGDVLEMIAEIEVSGLSPQITRVTPLVAIYDESFTTLLQAEGVYAGDDTGHPDDVARQVIRTTPWAIQAGTPAWQLFGFSISFKNAAGSTPVSGVIKFGEHKVRKVPSEA